MLKMKIVIYFILVAILTVALEGCSSRIHPSNPYINNDSTSIYSTNSSRPFKYGYAYTKEESNLYFSSYLKNFKIENGDYVADVGAASGWIEGAMAVFTDSVTFFIEDIDTNLLNKEQLDAVVKHYSKLRMNPQSNNFHLVIGSQFRTGLLEYTFNKIILNNVLHEIKFPYSILNDLYYKLKQTGKIIVHENFSNKYKIIRHDGCLIKAFKSSYVFQMFKVSDYYLTGMSSPQNSFINYFTFGKNKSESDNFKARQFTVNSYITELDKLNYSKVNKDSVAVFKIANLIKNNLDEIQNVYPELEDYFQSLGWQLIKEKRYTSAINISQACVFLFPQSTFAYKLLGDAFVKNGQYDNAIKSLNMSIDLNENNKDAVELIKKISPSVKSK